MLRLLMLKLMVSLLCVDAVAASETIDPYFQAIQSWYEQRSNTRISAYKFEYREIAPGVVDKVFTEEVNFATNRNFLTSRISHFNAQTGEIVYRLGARTGDVFPGSVDFFVPGRGIYSSDRLRLDSALKSIMTNDDFVKSDLVFSLVSQLMSAGESHLEEERFSIFYHSVENKLYERVLKISVFDLEKNGFQPNDLLQFFRSVELYLEKDS